MWCRARRSCVQVKIGLGLVEVPPQGGPEHHRNLTRGRCHRFEVAGGRVDYIRDVEAVASQSGGSEAGDPIVIIAAGISILKPSPALLLRGTLGVLFTVNDDGPTWRESGALPIEVVGLESDPAEDGRHSKGEAVGQVAVGVSHIEGLLFLGDCRGKIGGIGETQGARIRHGTAFAFCPSPTREKLGHCTNDVDNGSARGTSMRMQALEASGEKRLIGPSGEVVLHSDDAHYPCHAMRHSRAGFCSARTPLILDFAFE